MKMEPTDEHVSRFHFYYQKLRFKEYENTLL